jgi:hypothetical protein
MNKLLDMQKNLFFILALLLVMITAPVIVRAPALESVFAQQTSSPTPTPTQQQKIEQMDILMGEHALVGGELMIARYSRRPDYNEAKKAVDNNSQLIAAQIDDFYNTGAKNQFLTLWNRHIDDLLTYSDARRSNDTAKANNAIKDLQGFTSDMANLLSSGNSKTDFKTAQNYLAQHVMDEKGILDAYADHDYAKMYETMHEAYIHATSITSILMPNQ